MELLKEDVGILTIKDFKAFIENSDSKTEFKNMINQYDFAGCYKFLKNLHAFSFCSMLTELLLKNKINPLKYMDYVPAYFLYESNLKISDIPTMPSNIKFFESRAFCGYKGLESITIPEGAPMVNDNTFAGCIQLEQVYLPNSIKEIADAAFWNCTKLSRINLPDGLYKIGEYAFIGCSNLRYLDIPKSIHEIGTYAFSHCENLSIICHSQRVEKLIRDSGFDGKIEVK